MKHFEPRTDPVTGQRYLLVTRRGVDLKADPLLNKGTCFSREERDAFDLGGLLPPAVSSVAEQEARSYGNFLCCKSDVERYLYLNALQDRNETLFFRVLLDHLEEMVPIVYTPTVGRACQSYSHIYRRPRGVYLSPDDRGRFADILKNSPVQDCKVIVVTDNEAILGLGDLGVGGMAIPIGKLSLYSAGAGIHPASCLPIDLDVGTERDKLLEDPMYLGTRRRRLRGEQYFELVDELVAAVKELFPGAVLQWEDFANENAFQILARHRENLLSFNDDIQGTAAVVLAGILGGLHQAGRDLADERIVFLGCGAAGGGCALALRTALRQRGMAEDEVGTRVLCLDSRGLIVDDRPGLLGHKRDLAAPRALVESWERDGEGFDLAAVVRGYRPTILIGTSGQPGSFTESIIKDMHASCSRPLVFPLSNPTSKAEATPADLLGWTNGLAIVTTGSPFPPVDLGGHTYEIGQANNVLVFPGLGMGAVACEATYLPDDAFLAAARALFRASHPSTVPGAPLFPRLSHLREISHAVASGVAEYLVGCGAAPQRSPEEIQARIDALTWEPAYLPYRSSVEESCAVGR